MPERLEAYLACNAVWNLQTERQVDGDRRAACTSGQSGLDMQSNTEIEAFGWKMSLLMQIPQYSRGIQSMALYESPLTNRGCSLQDRRI